MPHMRPATLLVILLTLLVTVYVPAQTAAGQPAASDPLLKQVEQIAATHHGQVSVFAKALKTGQTIALKADEPVQTASVIKLGLLYEAMEQIRAGKAHWDDKVVLTKDNQTNGSGVLGFFDTPATLTLKDVLSMMVITSDNTATNVAIDKIGLDGVNAEMGKLGLKNTWLYKKIGKPANYSMPPDQKKFGLGKTTAREMATLMERIVTCQLGDGAAPPTESDRAICGVALHMLRSQFYRDGVPRYLEPVDSSEEGSAIANKTGALDTVRNDVDAIATKNGLLILSIFTWDNKDQSWTDDNEAYLTTANIAKAIVNTWSPEGLDVKAFEIAGTK
ncbi:MAG: serine hydrolase [Acidobacteriaceae bacterium]